MGVNQKNMYEQYSSKKFLEFEDTCDYQDDETLNEISKLDLKGVVVDIGCGYGWYLEALKPRFKKYIGIEPNDFLRGLAKKRGKELGINSKFLKGVAEKIPLEDRCADFVITTYALNEIGNIENIRKALKEILRISKPGATWVICDLTGGSRDGYTKILNLVEINRGEKNNFPSELADMWIEIFLFLSKYAKIIYHKRVYFKYKFKNKRDAIEKTSAIIPDLKTNKKVLEAVKKFYKKPVLSCEGLFIVAKFKN
ncbi:MAG: class I SAM-dependent methyltransferase [Candidatus Aenigmatarchaeota archaeon]